MIPIIYPGNTIPNPIAGSVLEPYHAQCTNQHYAVYGSYYGNVYEKQFFAMPMTADGHTLTGFGILIAKRGTPSAPLIVGITLGSPPDNPLDSASYVEQATIQPNLLGQVDTFYWATFYLTTPIDITHYTPWAVAVTDANYDTQTNYWVWGACNGISDGLGTAEKWIPQTMGLVGSLDCDGPGPDPICAPEGVDITVQPIIVNYYDVPPYTPLTNIIVGNNYKVVVTMHNGQWLLCENYTLDFYWDDDTPYFGCYKNWIPANEDQTIEFLFNLQLLFNGQHVLKVKMLEKPSVEFDINVIVEGGPYEWTATPDTASFFIYTQSTGAGCTNPDGSEGSWYCNGTTKRTCTGGQWVDEPNSPDCQQPTGCTNPDGSEGDLHCFGNDLYKCQSGSWQLFTQDATECAGCNCGTYQNPTDCGNAKGSQQEECCWWYQKYFWEPATCHSTMQDYLRDYLPLMAVGAGVGVLLIGIFASRGGQYVPVYYPPAVQSKPRPRRKQSTTTKKRKK